MNCTGKNIKHEYLRSRAYIRLSLSSSSSGDISIKSWTIENRDTRAYILDPCIQGIFSFGKPLRLQREIIDFRLLKFFLFEGLCTKLKGCNLEQWIGTYVDKAKMRLRGGRIFFFNFPQFVYICQPFVYNLQMIYCPNTFWLNQHRVKYTPFLSFSHLLL